MYNYDPLKIRFGRKVPQTVDQKILILDFWDLGDAFGGLAVIMLFGIILYAWIAMFLFLFFVLIAGPLIKRRYNRGIFLHWPYRHLGMSLPGFVNPIKRKKYSD